jgi:hypothetical protein
LTGERDIKKIKVFKINLYILKSLYNNKNNEPVVVEGLFLDNEARNKILDLVKK